MLFISSVFAIVILTNASFDSCTLLMYTSWIQRVPKRTLASPPSYFANPQKPPKTYKESAGEYSALPLPQLTLSSQNGNANQDSQQNDHQPPLISPTPAERPLRELTTLLAMFTLAYLAVDNYSSRAKLEKVSKETTALNLKALQLQQQNFLAARRQQDLRLLKERADASKKSYRMALHIAMLRQQLEEQQLEPVSVDAALQEFEKHVKIQNLALNLTGQAIWVVDSSELAGRVPDPRVYEREK